MSPDSKDAAPPSSGHGAGLPSDWVLRWSQAWRDRDGATALDLACGSGRHLRLLAGDIGMQAHAPACEAASG